MHGVRRDSLKPLVSLPRKLSREMSPQPRRRRSSLVDPAGYLGLHNTSPPTPRRHRRPSHDVRVKFRARGPGGAEKKPPIVVWPEWSDGDINAEKWDVTQKGKEKDKGKSPGAPTYFDDPEGRIEMPPSLHIDSWKRPGEEQTLEKTYVVVDPEGHNAFDLLTMNDHIFESELLRWIVGQIIALWQISEIKNPDGTVGTTPVDPGNPSMGEYTHSWRPWEHIYSINKIGKGPNMPAYNPCGKYAVKLYWMGSWRKIIVDDLIPYDDQGRPLLPTTTLVHELWPLILTKGLMKIAGLDMTGQSLTSEFGDFSVIHCLTGWIPETIPLQTSLLYEMWSLLKGFLPEFKLPEPKQEEPHDADGNAKTDPALLLEGDIPKEKTMATEKSEKPGDKKDKKVEEKKKDEKKDKRGGDKEKEKTKKLQEKSMLNQDETVIPEHPEVVIFASYRGPPKYPVKMATLREMANASETLRQKGLSHLYPHPVLLTQTRSCPLEPPPPPEVVPKWKLIRPRKKKTIPSDQPKEEVVVEEKPIMSVQINSPFINYKVSPMPIPTETSRPVSTLERGQSRTCSRPGTANVDTIDESDENAPEIEVPPVYPVQPVSPPLEDFPPDAKTSEKESKQGPVAGKKKKLSVTPPSARSKDSTTIHMPSGKKRDSLKVGDIPVIGDRKKGSASTAAPGHDDLTPAPADSNEEMIGQDEHTSPPPDNKSTNLWMDFDQFCRCFKTLYVYHKPNTYPYNQKFVDMKSLAITKDGKKTNPNTAMQGMEEKSPQFILVDSLKPCELIVAYTALSRWPEPPIPIVMPSNKEDSKAEFKAAGAKGKVDKGLEKEQTKLEAQTTDSGSMIVVNPPEPRVIEKLQPGLITAEPSSWKSLVSGQPVLRLRTTGVKSCALQLPPGRHVLKMNMTAPLAYHTHICSTTDFMLADEDKIMGEITRESCRFKETANQFMLALGKVINSFHDTELLVQAWDEFMICHCPYQAVSCKSRSKTNHWKIFLDAFWTVLRKQLTDGGLANPDMAQAWRSFLFDCTTLNPLGLQFGGSSRPNTSAPVPDRSSASKGAKPGKAPKREVQDPKLEQWKVREATPEEHVAATEIQKIARGMLVRKVQSGCSPGTDDNLRAQEMLQKAYTLLEQNAEAFGLGVYRAMFKLEPELMPFFPFYKDEWNKISYLDVSGVYPDQPANSWFVIYRDVFTVSEDMLIAPKLYTNLATASLKVIDNDTGVDIPRVFHKVTPHIYKKNKRGYTFFVEGRSLDAPLPSGRWRIRLISSMTPLPTPSKPVETPISFHAREIRDHYIPNDKDVICRYTVKAHDEHLASLQFSTSAPDVYIRLQVLDGDEELMSREGRGHVVIPAFLFSRNALDDTGRVSRASIKGGDMKPAKGVTIKNNRRSSSATSQASKKSLISDDDEEHEKEPAKVPRYIIQAIVLRNSWKLNEVELKLVEQLRWQEKEEMKASYDPLTSASSASFSNKDRPGSAPKDAAKGTGGKAGGKGKDGKGGKGGKEKAADKKEVSRPPSQQLDLNKPNYLLRVVSEATTAEDVDVKKDTSRVEEIRAIKRAWEEAEPGRAAKAIQSRMQYLNTHLLKPMSSEEDLTQGRDVSEQTSNALSVAKNDSGSVDEGLQAKPRFIPTEADLVPLDITPFIRKTLGTPIVRDAEVQQRQQEEREREMKEFKLFWEGVERRRQEERVFRNNLKVQQITMCTKMQLELDRLREEVLAPREAYRQKFLEAERQKQEELAAKEAELQAEAEKNKQLEGKKSAKNSAKNKKK